MHYFAGFKLEQLRNFQNF